MPTPFSVSEQRSKESLSLFEKYKKLEQEKKIVQNNVPKPLLAADLEKSSPIWTASVYTSSTAPSNFSSYVEQSEVDDTQSPDWRPIDSNMAPARIENLHAIEKQNSQAPSESMKSVCPVHKQEFVLFEDYVCSHEGCIYFESPEERGEIIQSVPQLKSSYQKNRPLTQRKRTYEPLKLFNPNAQHHDFKLSNLKERHASGGNANYEKSNGAIPVRSFYRSKKTDPVHLTNQPEKTVFRFERRRYVSGAPEFVTIVESSSLSDSSIPSPTPTPIFTRNRKESVPPNLYFPYEIGLKNLGNTCYVNATLQVLLALPGFSEDLKAACTGVKHLPECVDLFNKMAIARKKGMLSEVNKLNDDYVHNLDLLHPSYGSQDQQDANEFLIRLIEHMRQVFPSGPKNPVETNFQCELVEVHHCRQCGAKSKRVQSHTSLCLPILENSYNLEQCLENYTSEEERPIECPKCKATCMMVGSKFRTLPNKLIMSVNRYSKEEKVMKPIVPPEELDISRFLENSNDCLESTYNLTAQIIHVGDSKSSGHYVSHVLCDDGMWRAYNDMDVRPISFQGEIQTVKSESAYIYFYVNKSVSRNISI